MSKEKEDEGRGKTATAVDNQGIKKSDTRSGRGRGNREQRGERGVAALMWISFGFGVLSVPRLRHARVER